MYITCEQCSTIFRLDEKRLKPAGSKVRCCQCRNVFVAWPPAPAATGPVGAHDMGDAAAQYVVPSLEQPGDDTFDQELEGIDLAELDSILDQDRTGGPSGAEGDGSTARAAEESGEFEDSDLDMDFESELALDDDGTADSAVETAGEAPDEDLELDMDFELDPSASEATESPAEDRLVEDELEMDFELGDDVDQQPAAPQQDAPLDVADDVLDDNIDAVLDDFEDVLNEPESAEDEASPASSTEDVAEAEEEFDLSDLEDVLDTTEESGSTAEDVDLGDIEAALDAPAAEEETADEDDFDIDLSDLDMDLDDDDASESEDAGLEDGLSLDDDETVALEEPPASEADEAPAAADEAQEEDFDLSDLDGLMELDEEEGSAEEEASPGDDDTELSLDDDLSLDEEAAPSAGPAVVEEAAPSDAQEDEEVFDLSDLDGLMDLDEEEGSSAEEAFSDGGDADLSLDDDLSLDLDGETVAETGETDGAAAGIDMQEDELDLGGLDTMLDDDQPSDDSELEDLELSLDDDSEERPAEDQELTLEMEDATEQPEESAAGSGDDELDLGGLDNLLDDEGESADDSGLEDLELSLDDGTEPSDEQAEGTTDEDEEMDLSDLEQMLESETLVPEPVPQDQPSELSLTGKDEKFTDTEADSLGLDSGSELDLSEIEAAIDSAEDDTDAGGDEELDLELDFDSAAADDQEPQEAPGDELDLELEMESDVASVVETADDDQEAIDLSDMDMDMDLSLDSEEPEGEGEVVNGGDIELEFQIEDEMEPATIDSAETMPGDIATASAMETTTTVDADKDLIEEAFAEKPEAGKESEAPKPEKKKKQKTKKKGSSAGLIAILILALLGAGGYFGYQYAVEHNIEIPYLNDLIHPQPQDPSGTAKLTTMDINSKFIDNKEGGRIFVVTGKVRNGYAVPCNKIQLQGKLYTKGKVLSKTELVYAGVAINDLELAGQPVAQIKQRLKTGGGQTAELVVNAGQTLPFMVVFTDLPDDLDEFAIELLNSTKVQ